MISQPQPSVYFICDANSTSGMGHFLRCISLAIRLRQKNGQHSIFVGDFSAAAMMFASYYRINIQSEALTVAKRLQDLPTLSRVVLDSYQYSCSELPDKHLYVLIDDFCVQKAYPVAGVINFTYQASRYNYCVKGARHQALGLSYYLAHPSLPPSQSEYCQSVSRILVLIGSGDPYQLSEQIVVALQGIGRQFEIKVVTNKAREALSQASSPLVQYVPQISDVNQYYQWADFCITSGGLAKYECAYLAKPAAVISLTAAEQAETDGFAANCLCFDLGYHGQIEPERLAKDLERIILQSSQRMTAHKACLTAFKGHSSLAITEFVERCWEHSA